MATKAKHGDVFFAPASPHDKAARAGGVISIEILIRNSSVRANNLTHFCPFAFYVDIANG